MPSGDDRRPGRRGGQGDGRDPDRRRDRDDRGGDDGGGIGFTLPPLKLPPLRVPEGFRLRLPIPERPPRGESSRRARVVATLLWDAIDAGMALAGVPPTLAWGRVLAGTGVAATATGVYATLYAWEIAALAAGYPRLTALPTLTALLLLRARR